MNINLKLYVLEHISVTKKIVTQKVYEHLIHKETELYLFIICDETTLKLTSTREITNHTDLNTVLRSLLKIF